MTEETGKTHEYKGRTYTEIPEEITDKLGIEPGEEIKFKNPQGKLVILTTEELEKQKKEQEKKKTRKKEKEEKGEEEEDTKELGPQELEALQKIGEMKHWERTPENIEQKLNEKEIEKYKEMLDQDILFEYTKKGEKRIGIDRDYFALATDKEPKKGEKNGQKDKNKDNKKKKKTKGRKKPEPKKPMDKLEKQKYIVIKDKGKAEDLQQKLRKQDKGEEVKGVRGFDKKFYIMKKDKLDEIEEEIEERKLLEEEKPLSEIAEELGLNEKQCKTALVLLREEGKVVEKGKNVYQTT